MRMSKSILASITVTENITIHLHQKTVISANAGEYYRSSPSARFQQAEDALTEYARIDVIHIDKVLRGEVVQTSHEKDLEL